MPRGPRRRFVSRRRKAPKPNLLTVRRMIYKAQETKRHYNYLNTTSSTTASIAQLDAISTGTTDYYRIGDKIRYVSMRIGFNIAYADATNIMRICVFQWNSDSTPTTATVFEDTSSAITQLMGAFNHDSLASGKLKVLYDSHQTLSQSARPNFYWQKHISLLRAKPTQFNSGLTYGVGNIFIMHMSDSSAIAHPALQLAYTLLFKDA